MESVSLYVGLKDYIILVLYFVRLWGWEVVREKLFNVIYEFDLWCKSLDFVEVVVVIKVLIVVIKWSEVMIMMGLEVELKNVLDIFKVGLLY